jgi:hypothetical protein
MAKISQDPTKPPKMRVAKKTQRQQFYERRMKEKNAEVKVHTPCRRKEHHVEQSQALALAASVNTRKRASLAVVAGLIGLLAYAWVKRRPPGGRESHKNS